MSSTEVARLDAQDERYVRAWFVPLDLLAPPHGWDPENLRLAIAQRRIPQPTYVLADGTAMLPADYFALVGDPAASASLRERFFARYHAACARNELTADACEAEWSAYLGGGYGACLKELSPEAIVHKTVLIARIETLLDAEAPDARDWVARLRAAVDALDAIEKPFARSDRARFGGPVTRDRFIDDVRRRYPGIVEAS
ncbi:MAG TPA: DUF6058 family natural product biosynthesis protein [Candidatus Limnocylindria bacterium]|jgi:hypothetical protein|nr:DUF6058 family natural product biosynthesis protein [Candidatus Limnocylindria bacterium]